MRGERKMLLDFTLSRKRSFSLGRVNFIIHLSLSLSLSVLSISAANRTSRPPISSRSSRRRLSVRVQEGRIYHDETR